jgi:hypothetical protein
MTARQEKRQHDDCRRREQKAIIQSPTGAEERVGDYAGDDENECDHQPNPNPVPANVAGHEPKIAGRLPECDQSVEVSSIISG